MSKSKRERNPLDVRTKLLVILSVLSLPLLIISLTQLAAHQRSLDEQAATIARVENAAAAAALQHWFEDHPEQAADSAALPEEAARVVYERVRAGAAETDTAVAIFDTSGRLVPNPSGARHVPPRLPTRIGEMTWDDRVLRVTSARRLEPSGWTVVVGVPVAVHTPSGRSIVTLTVTWALALLASFLLAFWAVGRFTKPLRRLAAAASTLGEGHLDERATVETDDEVGTLAENFNLMAASLQAKFEEVRRQGVFISEVLDSLPLGVAVLDATLTVRKVNTTFAEMVGRDAKTLDGRGLYEAAAGLAVLSEVVEDVRRTRSAFVNYGLPLDLVARADAASAPQQKHWDVILWPVTEQTGGAGSLILILSEVSKRVRAEKMATSAFAAEKARAAELESVINQVDEGVVIIDAQGRYRINPAGMEILGRRREEFRDGVKALVVDMALRGLDGHLLAPEESPICRAFERGEHVAGQRVKTVRNDGEERVLAVGATPLVGEGGHREGAASVFRDITEEVARHEELVGAYERLREHDRMKSAFVASVSHELRTPLNVILGLCQLLRRDPQAQLLSLQDEAVVRMERNARALLELVNDMLDYSRLEAGRSALHIESVDVPEVARAVVAAYDAEAREKNIELWVEVSPELSGVHSDRQKLQRVLSCLVSNAVKFTSSGAVRIAAAPLDDARWYVEVSDTGIGIASDALQYIFDGFRQVDDRLARSYSGVGLGLAIARRIVELLEGEITVESRPNEGSRFRIIWPREVQARTGTGSLVMDGPLSLADLERRQSRVS
ncbi:MAG TPA: ATP-binding protein [Pyrinomonadaceae bacterium]|nr:ATP-binding protein [Pyrinomonadaceae bacterium]